MDKLAELYGASGTNGNRKATALPPRKPRPAEQVRAGLIKKGFRVVAEYPYGDDLRKVRLERPGTPKPKKEFKWEHREGDAWWSGQGGKPVPLYANKVFWDRDQLGIALGLEGEPKVHIAGELGIPAFSFKELTLDNCKHLAGLPAVLWPDKDEEGDRIVLRKASLIHESQQTEIVKIITPPEVLSQSGDIVDAVRKLAYLSAQLSGMAGTDKSTNRRPTATHASRPHFDDHGCLWKGNGGVGTKEGGEQQCSENDLTEE